MPAELAGCDHGGAASSGSNANPVPLWYGFDVPRLSPDGTLPALQLPEPARVGQAEVALAAVLTQEGTVLRLKVLRSSGLDQSLWEDLWCRRRLRAFDVRSTAALRLPSTWSGSWRR